MSTAQRDKAELNGAVLYLGDALDVLRELPAGTVDCILADPPYCSGAHNEAQKASRGAMKRGEEENDRWFASDNLATVGFQFLLRSIFVECYRLARNPAALHCWIDWRMYPALYAAAESAGWSTKNLLVWDKGTPGLGANYRNQHELILYAEKGVVQFTDRAVANVLRHSRVTDPNHPTVKPEAICERLILATTNPGATVLDPFAGSGTTLRAALNTGRRAIGIEIDDGYFANATDRLRQMMLFPLELEPEPC